MAIVGYRRVSSADQRLDRQDLDKGPSNPALPDKVFEDKVSGKDLDRPGLVACLSYVREGDTLRVHSADRLSRSLVDLVRLVDELNGRGVVVELVKEKMVFDP